MSTLKLTKDTKGAITAASIDDKVIDGFVSATQSLERGVLKAVLTVNFDTVTVVAEPVTLAASPKAAPVRGGK